MLFITRQSTTAGAGSTPPLSARHDHVGAHALSLDGEHVPSAAETGLDLVGDEEHVVSIAQATHLGEIASGGNTTPPSPWMAHNKGGYALPALERAAEAPGVARGTFTVPGSSGAKPVVASGSQLIDMAAAVRP